MFELIRIYFLSIKRSTLFDAKLIKKILSLIGFGYLFVNFVFIGLFLDKILVSIEPDSSPMDTFSRIFLFILVVDIILKFFYKSNKHIDILPYLTLPVKQRIIFSLMFFKELLSKWNFIWVVILTPFFFKTFYPTNGLSSTLLLILILYFLSITISFVIRFVNNAMVQKSFFYFFLPIIIFVSLLYLSFYILFAPDLLINLNLLFTNYEILVLFGMIFLFACLYVLFLKSCKHEIYSQHNGRNRFVFSFNIGGFNNLGINGEILKLCIKEVSRSQLKRNLLASLILMIYSLFVYKMGNAPFIGRVSFAIIPSIMIGTAFGESSFSSESTFFDKLMVSPQNTAYLILINKYVICVLFSTFTTILSIMLSINVIPILFWLSILFFECGILLFFIFQNAVYNKQRFDILGPLRKISDSNIHSFLFMVFFMVFFGIVLLIAGLISEKIACYFMLIVGMAFTLTSPLWLKNIYKRFLIRKYQNMNGFRNI